MIKQKPLFVLLVLLVLVSLACANLPFGSPTETPEPTATEVVLPTDTAVPTETAVPTAAPTDTAVPEPVEEPTQPPADPTLEGVVVDQVFFVQDESTLMFAFYINNYDTANAYTDSDYDVVVYDADDNILQTSYGYVNMIRASEKLGVVNSVYMDEGQVANRVEIGFKPGDAAADSSVSPFVVGNIIYLEDEYFPVASCTIENTSDMDITDVYVSALAFDENGNFIGGGYTYQYFVLSQTIAGTTISLTGTGTPARVEVYPTLSGFTEFRDVPQGTPEMVVQEMGAVIEDGRVGVAFFVQNTVADQGIEDSLYQVTIYDAGGNVLGTTMGYINTALPGDTMPVYTDIYLTDNTTPDNYTVQVLAGDLVEPVYTSNPFSITDAVFLADEYSPKATGTLVNSLAEAVDGLLVVAVAYDAAGEIIGGGYAYVDGLPASGTLPVEVWVTVLGDVEKIELYPVFTSLTEIGGE